MWDFGNYVSFSILNELLGCHTNNVYISFQINNKLLNEVLVDCQLKLALHYAQSAQIHLINYLIWVQLIFWLKHVKTVLESFNLTLKGFYIRYIETLVCLLDRQNKEIVHLSLGIVYFYLINFTLFVM